MIVLKILLFMLLFGLVMGALLLFFPFVYRVSGESDGTLHIKARVNWLGILLNVVFTIAVGKEKEDPRLTLYVFGIPIKLYPRKKKKNKRKEKKAKDKKEPTALSVTEENPQEQTEEKPEETGETSPEDAEEKETEEPEKPPLMKRLKRIMAKFGRIKRELGDERNKEAVSHLMKEGQTVLQHLLPRWIRTNLAFSTGDPASTGMAIGAMSVLPFLYQRGNRIVPDFEAEKAYLDGKFSVTGRVIVFVLLLAGLRLIFDKNIRRLIKHVWALRK